MNGNVETGASREPAQDGLELNLVVHVVPREVLSQGEMQVLDGSALQTLRQLGGSVGQFDVDTSIREDKRGGGCIVSVPADRDRT
jgi:carbamoylphosphate synthase large subunit